MPNSASSLLEPKKLNGRWLEYFICKSCSQCPTTSALYPVTTLTHTNTWTQVEILIFRCFWMHRQQQPRVRTCLGINPLASISKGTACHWWQCNNWLKLSKLASLSLYYYIIMLTGACGWDRTLYKPQEWQHSILVLPEFCYKTCISIVRTFAKIQLFGLKISSLVSTLSAETCQRAQPRAWKPKQRNQHLQFLSLLTWLFDNATLIMLF